MTTGQSQRPLLTLSARRADVRRLRATPAPIAASPGADAPTAAPQPPTSALRKRPPKQWEEAQSDIELQSVEWVVLQLVHLDPRLTNRAKRSTLLRLMITFTPQRTAHRIGMALAFLRDRAAAGIVHTRAFARADTTEVPTVAACRAVFTMLTAAGEEGLWSPCRLAVEWRRMLRLLGHDEATVAQAS